METWEVILKDVCPDTSTPSTSCLPSLETLASLLQNSQKPPDSITRTDDVIKALDVWVSCFDRLGVEFRAETGLMKTYFAVICGLPPLLLCPKKTSAKATVHKFSQAITSGVMMCVKLLGETPNLTGSKFQIISEVAEVSRIFAEDFCELWRADLGVTLIPQLLNAAMDLKPGLSIRTDVAAAMHCIGAMSFCSGILCHLVTRCHKNQHLIQKHERFRDLMLAVLPAIPALDVQLDILEVFFRVYRNSRTMPKSQFAFEEVGLACIRNKLDKLVACKGQHLDLTKKLVDVAVAYNASAGAQSVCHTGCVMGPITVLPVTRAHLKSKGNETAICKDFNNIALSQSSIGLMMRYELRDGLQKEWLVIPTSTVKKIDITAMLGSQEMLVVLSATIPMAFNRNVGTQELLRAANEDWFDVALCLEMLSATAIQLEGVLRPLLVTHDDQEQRNIAQTRADLRRPPGLRAVHEASGHRRLSITTMPVYQPLTFRPLDRSAQPNDPVAATELKQVSGQGTVLHAPSTPGLIADNHISHHGEAGENLAATNVLATEINIAAPHDCMAAPIRRHDHGLSSAEQFASHGQDDRRSKDTLGNQIMQLADKNNVEENNIPPVQHSPSRSLQEPIFNRRKRKQRTHSLLESQIKSVTEKAAMLVLPAKPERGTVKYSDHASCKRNASSSGAQMGARRAKLSSDALNNVTPASHSGLSAQQDDAHPENRSGRPKRRAAQRQVNYKDHVDEASDPISDTSLPIPHAQAPRKKHTESCKKRQQKGKDEKLHCKRDRRLKKIAPAGSLPEVFQSGNSGTGDMAERVISETQSDDPSKSERKRTGVKAQVSGANASVDNRKQNVAAAEHARVRPSGDSMTFTKPLSSKQQTSNKAEIENRKSPCLGLYDEFPPPNGHAVVPSPLTSHKPFTSDQRTYVPRSQSFEFDAQKQLELPVFTRSICPKATATFCAPFAPDMTKSKVNFPSIIETNIQPNHLQALDNPPFVFKAFAHAGLGPQPQSEKLWRGGNFLPAARINSKQATNVATAPARKMSSIQTKRRCNEIENRTDDASQQAKDQQVTLMRMMNAMMQNEDDDDDDQHMVQLQAAMSKLMKTKEQRKMQQNNKAIQSSRKRLQDMLGSAVEQYTQEESHLEQSIASKLADTTQTMSDLWQIMSDMHSQHLSELASKWQQYQALGQKLNEDHHESLEKMAQMKKRWSGTLASLTQEAEVEMQHLEADVSKAKKRSRRQDPASMQKLLSALMQ